MRGASLSQGEQSGLAAVYAAERSALLRFLRARCGDHLDPEDLLQDLWLKLDNLPSGPIGNPRAYLFRMANNLVLDHRRAQHRAMQRDHAWLGEEQGSPVPADPVAVADPAPSAMDEISSEQEAQVLRRAIAQLPPGARRALELFRFAGHGQAEVAEIMGISRSGVEKHLALAMKSLRQALGDCGLFGAAASNEYRAAQQQAVPEDQGT